MAWREAAERERRWRRESFLWRVDCTWSASYCLSLCMRRENTRVESAARWNMGGQRSGGEHMARLLIMRNCT